MRSSILRAAGLAAGWAAVLAAGWPLAASAQGMFSGNKLNPSISLILDGQFSSYQNDSDDYEISGFMLDEEAGLSAEGFSLDETELVVSGNVDDWFYGYADVVFEDNEDGTEVELEEAYFETLSLPSGLALKGGKFLSAVGYNNRFHPHSWDFSDEPLVYRAMLGGALSDTGAQIRWLAPIDLFLEFGAEGFQGDGYPAAGGANDGVGAWTAFAKVGGDLNPSNSWKAGVSVYRYDVDDRTSDIEDGEMSFNGDGNDIYIGEFVWKWAPNGNPRQRNFKFQTEYFYRDENGSTDADTSTVSESGRYDLDQKGFYAQGVYQFRQGWRFGLRYDWLSADNTLVGITVPNPLDDDNRDPKRYTAMVDYARSEFSRLRLQFTRDESSSESDNQLFLQYIMSIGAHGAHQF